MAAVSRNFTASEREPYPEGRHLAQIVDWAENKNPAYGDGIKWIFELVELEREGDNPARVNFYSKFNATPKSNLGKLLLALNLPLDRAPQLNPDDLIGKQLFVKLEHEQGDDGQVWANIKGMLPIPKTKAAENTLAMPPPVVLPSSTPPTTREQQAAAVTAGEDAKAAAVSELRPLLTCLLAEGIKLSKENTGPGLQAVARSAKNQGRKLDEMLFDLVGIPQIKQAAAEAMVLLKPAAPAASEDEADPFAEEG